MLNYDINTDCFAQKKDVQSLLLYDNRKNIHHPFITVCVPTYKRPELLQEAFNSILAQKSVDFEWDIIIVDNEAYDGKANKTEKAVRSISSERIAYYRNSEHMRGCDNFNRGILLAQAPWVMMLHDDDLLLKDTLYKMNKAIRFLSSLSGKPLGAIGAAYYSFKDEGKDTKQYNIELEEIENYYQTKHMSLKFWHWTRLNVFFTGHPSGTVPTNGTTFNREAVLSVGGFNEDLGRCADIYLFYCLEKYYSCYCSTEYYGFYRYGNNQSSQLKTIQEIIQCGIDFREYVYSRNIFTKFWGYIFKNFHYLIFSKSVAEAAKKYANLNINIYETAYPQPGKLSKILGSCIYKLFMEFKKAEMQYLRHKFKYWLIKNKQSR